MTDVSSSVSRFVSRSSTIQSLVRGCRVSRCRVRWRLVTAFDDGVEAVVVVGGVLDGAGRTTGLQKAVRALDVTVAVAVLVLALDVVIVRVVYALLEAIRGGC